MFTLLRTRRMAALGLASVVLIAAAPAQAAAQLTIRTAVAHALQRNPTLRAADRAIDAARARETQAGALPNPNLALSIDQVPIPNPIDGNYMAGISQPLLLAGQREARVEVARLDVQLAELDREVLRQDLALNVKNAYSQVFFAIAETSLAGVNFDAIDALYRAAKDRYQGGQVARIEVLQAEVERSRALRGLEAARNRLVLSRGPLNVLLGRESTAPLSLGPLPAPRQDGIPMLATLIGSAIAVRPELMRAEVSIRRETLARQLAQTGVWTGTEVSGLAGAVQGQPGFSLALTVPIPFYRQQGEVAEAEANRLRAEAERDALRNTITQEVDRAYGEASIAAQQAGAFVKSHLPHAGRLVRNAQDRLKAGEGGRQEVLNAQRELRESQHEFQLSLLTYREALNRLERAVGRDLLQN